MKHDLKDLGLTKLPRDVLVYEIDGPFFFGAVENFESALKQTRSDPRVLIVRLHRVPFIDSSGLQAMDEVIQALQKRGVRVMLCEANERVRAKLWKYGVLDKLQSDGYADRLSAHLAKAVDRSAV